MSLSLPFPPGGLDLIPVPTLAIDGSGMVTTANTSARELCGRGELVGLAFESLLDARDITGIDLDDAEGDALRLSVPDCTPQFVRLFSRPIDGGGSLVCLTPAPSDALVDGISGGHLDATLLARAVDSANNSITVAEITLPDAPLVFVNKGFLKLTGYELEDVIGRNCRFLQVPGGGYLDPETLEAALEASRANDPMAPGNVLRRALSAREVIDGLVIQNYKADGTPFWNELFLTPVDDADGVTHYIGVQNDVTERVEAQARLRREASQFKAIINSMPMPIGMLQAYDGGRIRHVLANTLAADVFSLDPETDVGLDGLGFRGEARTLWIDAVHRAEGTGAPVRFEAKRADDQTFEVLVSPVHGNTDRPDVPTRYFYIARNVTAGVRMEHDLLQISARELSRVAQDIHDGVGQTLVGASMLSSALAVELESSEHSSEADRLQQLVRAALGQLRQFALGIDPIDIEDLGIDQALARLAADVEALFGVHVSVDEEPCNTDLSPEASLDVYRIVQEALTNAVRHGHAEHVDVRLVCDGTSITLTIADNGDGIPDGPRRNLDGMGLRTMRARARRLGGRLEIRPNPRGGTTVHVRARRLPLTA